MTMSNNADILEDNIYNISPDLLTALLKDHTTSTPEEIAFIGQMIRPME